MASMLKKIENKLSGGSKSEERKLEQDAATGTTTGTGTHHHHGHHTTGTTGVAGGRTGEHTTLENHSAIPTAGGEPLGAGATTTGHHHNHHYGRDAALTGGAVGVGEHEAHKHHHGGHHHGHNVNTGPAPNTAGPHSSDMANRLDPRVDSDPARAAEHGHHYGRDAALAGGAAGVGIHEHEKHRGLGQGTSTVGPHGSDTMNRLDPRFDSDPARSAEHGHHYGRDAALAGGAAGVGIHEHEKHRGQQAPTTTGPHSSDLMNKLDPRVDSDASRTNPSGAHHYGRDAALAGGATGVGIHEHDRHHPQQQTTTGPHSSDLLNKLDPRVDSDASRTDPSGHHYGRDAAVAGGAAGVGLHEHEKHHTHSHGGIGGVGSSADPKKMGGAYEAGYRDAMAHAEGERRI